MSIAASLLTLILAVPAAPVYEAPRPVAVAVAASEWKPEPGDTAFIDTRSNDGYLVHDDGRYLRFPVVTGQRRGVYYIGRSYNATTPATDWVIQSSEVKGDRVTFGPSGRFLRLWKDDERTAYGFHEHRDEEEMFGAPAEERYRSMGCIILESSTMDIFALTLELNGSIAVHTRYGIDDISTELMAQEKTAEEKL
ncbi:L,D-transpeptidase [Candidatus Peregrinibacteria bacterium]|nr:L,D-transpeptidase [Candidatus Peregrinibacteria bacterium]